MLTLAACSSEREEPGFLLRGSSALLGAGKWLALLWDFCRCEEAQGGGAGELRAAACDVRLFFLAFCCATCAPSQHPQTQSPTQPVRIRQKEKVCYYVVIRPPSPSLVARMLPVTLSISYMQPGGCARDEVRGVRHTEISVLGQIAPALCCSCSKRARHSYARLLQASLVRGSEKKSPVLASGVVLVVGFLLVPKAVIRALAQPGAARRSAGVSAQSHAGVRPREQELSPARTRRPCWRDL